MTVDRDTQLAKVILTHSLSVKKGEKILVTVSGRGADPLVKAVYVEALKMGAHVMVEGGGQDLSYQFYKHASDEQIGYMPESVVKAKIEWADAYVRIVAEDNSRELAEIDPVKLTSRAKLLRPLMDPMIDSDRWVLTYYPTHGMAQQAGMSMESLTEFYYDSVLVDYQKMEKDLRAIEKILDTGSEVRVVGKKTDIKINIRGRLAQSCYGERNIPDGEVFVGPVHTEVNGEVYFDLPTLAYGHEVRGIHLEFVDGQVVRAVAEQGDEALQKMLATDQGARYLGEFAIGANYKITKPMMNTLFDEKIGGTIHMALGRSYKEERGGGTNESAIHWDIVKDMRLAGSRVEVDGKVVLVDGKIVV
jgi:aminopeptidase